MKSCSNVPQFQYRSKFEKFAEKFSPHERELIDEVFLNFVEDPDDARCANILWQMTYNEFSGLDALGIRVKDDYVMDDIIILETPSHHLEISKEMVKPLRNELRFQRMRLHPNFLIVHYPEGSEQSFKNMLHTFNDPVLTYVACEHCHKICATSSEVEINRIAFLLGCTKKENVFGGIRSLNFTAEQTVLFMNYNLELRDYLESVWSSIVQELENEAPSYSSVTPLYHQLEDWCNAHPGILSGWENDGEENTLDKSSKKFHIAGSEDTTCKSSSLSVENILADQNELSLFLTSIKNLEKKGYDCSDLISKRERIEAIIALHSLVNEKKIL